MKKALVKLYTRFDIFRELYIRFDIFANLIYTSPTKSNLLKANILRDPKMSATK